MAVVERVFPSVSEKRVRKYELRLCEDGSYTYYTRPVTDTVLLIPV